MSTKAELEELVKDYNMANGTHETRNFPALVRNSNLQKAYFKFLDGYLNEVLEPEESKMELLHNPFKLNRSRTPFNKIITLHELIRVLDHQEQLQNVRLVHTYLPNNDYGLITSTFQAIPIVSPLDSAIGTCGYHEDKDKSYKEEKLLLFAHKLAELDDSLDYSCISENTSDMYFKLITSKPKTKVKTFSL